MKTSFYLPLLAGALLLSSCGKQQKESDREYDINGKTVEEVFMDAVKEMDSEPLERKYSQDKIEKARALVERMKGIMQERLDAINAVHDLASADAAAKVLEDTWELELDLEEKAEDDGYYHAYEDIWCDVFNVRPDVDDFDAWHKELEASARHGPAFLRQQRVRRYVQALLLWRSERAAPAAARQGEMNRPTPPATPHCNCMVFQKKRDKGGGGVVKSRRAITKR